MIETSAEYLLDRLRSLENKYLNLQADYQMLIHQYETLKENYNIMEGLYDRAKGADSQVSFG